MRPKWISDLALKVAEKIDPPCVVPQHVIWIGDAIEEAVAAEREACARVAETVRLFPSDVFRHRDGGCVTPLIARCIRDRGSDPARPFQDWGNSIPAYANVTKEELMAKMREVAKSTTFIPPLPEVDEPASKPDDVDMGPQFERNVAEFLGFGAGPYSDREKRIIKECVEKGKKAFEETGTSMMTAPDDLDRPADHPSNWTSGPIVDLGGRG